MKTMLVDWRNPSKWTRSDRKRPCSAASISNMWEVNPYGIQDVDIYIAIQPGVFRSSGVPVGAPTSFNAAWGKIVDEHPDWSLISGRSIILWSAGSQSVTAVDISNPEVVEAWINLIATHFTWADGIHFDYFTNLAWIAPDIPFPFWEEWDMGLVIATLKLQALGFKVLGQQYHLTPATDALDGLFLEESPGHFGLTFEEIAENMERHGREENWVIELRHPMQFPEWYREEVISFAWKHNCYLSWGRDAEAGVGFYA